LVVYVALFRYVYRLLLYNIQNININNLARLDMNKEKVLMSNVAGVQVWTKFGMSLDKYVIERPWHAFGISRQGFEFILTNSSNDTCLNLLQYYMKIKFEVLS